MRASPGRPNNKSCKHRTLRDLETEKPFSRAQWPLRAATLVRTISAGASLTHILASASRKVSVALNMKCLELGWLDWSELKDHWFCFPTFYIFPGDRNTFGYSKLCLSVLSFV